MIGFVGCLGIFTKYGGTDFISVFMDSVTGEIHSNLSLGMSYIFIRDMEIIKAKFMIAAQPNYVNYDIVSELKIGDGVVRCESDGGLIRDFKYSIYAIWRDSDLTVVRYRGLSIILRFDDHFATHKNCEGSLSILGSHVYGKGCNIDLNICDFYPYSCFKYSSLLRYALSYVKFEVYLLADSDWYSLSGFENCRCIL